MCSLVGEVCVLYLVPIRRVNGKKEWKGGQQYGLGQREAKHYTFPCETERQYEGSALAWEPLTVLGKSMHHHFDAVSAKAYDMCRLTLPLFCRCARTRIRGRNVGTRFKR